MKRNPRIATIYSILKHIEAQVDLVQGLVLQELGLPFSEISCGTWQRIRGMTTNTTAELQKLKPAIEEIETKLNE